MRLRQEVRPGSDARGISGSAHSCAKARAVHAGDHWPVRGDRGLVGYLGYDKLGWGKPRPEPKAKEEAPVVNELPPIIEPPPIPLDEVPPEVLALLEQEKEEPGVEKPAEGSNDSADIVEAQDWMLPLSGPAPAPRRLRMARPQRTPPQNRCRRPPRSRSVGSRKLTDDAALGLWLSRGHVEPGGEGR